MSWNAYDLSRVVPHYLSYANFFIGGTDRGHRYLLGSNYDWGQDLLRLKHWIDQHPQAEPLVFAGYNAVEPSIIGLNVTGLPVGPPGYGRRDGIDKPFQPYYLAISTNIMHGLPGPVPLQGGGVVNRSLVCRRGWEELEPFARPAPSIMVFRIESDDYDIFADAKYVSSSAGATP